VALAVAAPTSISVRSLMRLSKPFLALAILAIAPSVASGQLRATEISVGRGNALRVKPGATRGCTAAARAIREWGWSDSDGSGSNSVASIVAVVNQQLRLNSGQLPAKDIDRLRLATFSADLCVREVSIGILQTQSEKKVARGRSTRLVKSVTPLSAKQSSTGEDSTP
jgi:hypothetical protein